MLSTVQVSWQLHTYVLGSEVSFYNCDFPSAVDEYGRVCVDEGPDGGIKMIYIQ